MLRYTGHPLLDVGVATIVAFAEKDTPEEIEATHLEVFANYVAENYTFPPVRRYLTAVFPDSGFTLPNYFNLPEKQRVYADKVLRSYRPDTATLDNIDVFFGLPISNVHFDVNDNLSPGRVFRQHIPLLTGEDTINFMPYGEAGLSISGLALLCFQALPLGCAKCGGRMLAVHSDSAEIMLFFAQKFLEENRRNIQMARQKENENEKLPEAIKKFRTLVIEVLTEALQKSEQKKRQSGPVFDQPFSITVYHISNSGQGPALDIYPLPSQFIRYLSKMGKADYKRDWEQLISRAWIRPKPTKGETQATTDFIPPQNHLYEDLFRVAENPRNYAPRFIRTYFLREPLYYAKNDPTDPRGDYSPTKEYALISWKLTEPFLKEIMNMEERRIQAIRNLGIKLAEYIIAENDRKFFRTFYSESNYGYFRNALVKANFNRVKDGKPPLLSLDNYLAVFEVGEELAAPNWKLARDLVLICMIEELHKQKWFEANREAISDINRNENQDSDESK